MSPGDHNGATVDVPDDSRLDSRAAARLESLRLLRAMAA
jgi:hypothetical protein